MTVQTITLRLPEPLYRTARQIAQVTKRPIETVLQDNLSAVLPPLDDVEPNEAAELARLALLVEPVAGTFARQVGGNDVPPEMSRGVEAHLPHPGIGQGIEPGVEPGENGPYYHEQGLSRQGFINAFERFAARWFATWPWIRARELRETWRMSCLSSL